LRNSENISSRPSCQTDRKSQILEAAASIFQEKGYERASLQDIANKVGLTKATLYHYFKHKHDLLFAINYESITHAIDRMSHILKLSIAPRDKINLAFQQHFSFYLNNYPYLAVMLHEKTDQLPINIEQSIKSNFRQYILLWENLIKEGVDAGIFREDLDIKIMTWSAIGMCNWVYKWADSGGRLSFSHIASIFYQIYLNGITNKNIP